MLTRWEQQKGRRRMNLKELLEIAEELKEGQMVSKSLIEAVDMEDRSRWMKQSRSALEAVGYTSEFDRKAMADWLPRTASARPSAESELQRVLSRRGLCIKWDRVGEYGMVTRIT